MALAIATNNAALRAAASASSVNRDMETSMARLSSGKRINSASDDAAGVAISSRLTSNIRGTDQAIRNSLDGQALIDTAEGAHKEIENILQRMREVAVQAANDTNNAQDRANLQAEMDALSAEIDRIAGTTTWAGTTLLDKESSDFSFHIGAGVSEQDQVKVSIGSMTSSALGLGGGTASGSSSSSSGSGSGESSVTFTSGVNDTFDVSNGAEEINISVGLQAHLDSLSATTVGFDDPSTNRTRAASFDLSSITETITSAVLTIRAKPLDDERSEGNDTVVLSGFDTNGTASMPQYNIGLGVDAGPNNYFDFDWQIDGRPAVPNEGFEISIDLSNFAAQQGTSLNLLDDINTEKLLDIIIADDTLVDFVELTVSFPSTSSSASSDSITTPQRVGSEFQVNTYTASNQALSSVTALSDGSFVAVWQSHAQDSNTGTTKPNGVFGQRLDAQGATIDAEFQINTYTSDEQENPAVAALKDGGFVVTWTSRQDANDLGIFSQRYNSDGNPVGSEFQVNTGTGNNQIAPSVTGLEGGGFVITWESYGQDTADTYGVYGQRYDDQGVAQGTEFQINTTSVGDQLDSSIAALSGGGFVAAWQSTVQDNGNPGFYAQLYDPSGTAVGIEFKINSETTNFLAAAGTSNMYMNSLNAETTKQGFFISSLSDDRFVAAWPSIDTNGEHNGIFAQIFNADGTEIGSEFQINTYNGHVGYTGLHKWSPKITPLPDGGFAAVWGSGDNEQAGYGQNIFGQRFSAAGAKIGEEFHVDSGVDDGCHQTFPSVSASKDGKLIVTWQSSHGQDGDGEGIFAQIFDAGISSSLGSSSGSSSTTTGSSSSSSSPSSGPTLDSPSNAMAAISALDNAILTVNIQRSKLGAVSNRLSHTVNNLTNISSNLSAAQGGIEDADFAKETTDLAKNQILQQASTAMLAQANASKQNVLSLLQG